MYYRYMDNNQIKVLDVRKMIIVINYLGMMTGRHNTVQSP